MTCVVAIWFFFVLPNCEFRPAFESAHPQANIIQVPEDAKWLNDEERAYVKSRLAADQGEAALDRRVTLKDVGTAFKDVKLFLGG